MGTERFWRSASRIVNKFPVGRFSHRRGALFDPPGIQGLSHRVWEDAAAGWLHPVSCALRE